MRACMQTSSLTDGMGSSWAPMLPRALVGGPSSRFRFLPPRAIALGAGCGDATAAAAADEPPSTAARRLWSLRSAAEGTGSETTAGPGDDAINGEELLRCRLWALLDAAGNGSSPN